MKKQNKLQKLALQIGIVCGIMTALVGATKETVGLVKDWVGSDNKEEIAKMKDDIASLRKEVRMLRREMSSNILSSLAMAVSGKRTPASVESSEMITMSAPPTQSNSFKLGYIIAIISLIVTIILAIVYHRKHRTKTEH